LAQQIMGDTLKGSNRAYIAVDINERATRVTQRTAISNNVALEVIQGDLLSCFQTEMRRGIFDLIMFNPPYVPLDDEDDTEMEMHIRKEKSIEAAWIGGTRDGMSIVNRLMSVIPSALSPNGVFYLLLEQRNRPQEFVRGLPALGLTGSILKTRQVRGECLSILKITLRGS